MDWPRYYALIRKTPRRYDVAPIFENPIALSSLVKDLLASFREKEFNKIVGIDSLGFIIGAAMALSSKKPLVLARKGGKLPYREKNEIIRVKFKDYSGKQKILEMRRGSLTPGDRALLADEWIETGTQMRAAIKLVEKQGAAVGGIVAINADRNERTASLFENYKVKALHSGNFQRTAKGYGAFS
jgi:adenine phosphoribosyltransferase